jgi:hypothetical protein
MPLALVFKMNLLAKKAIYITLAVADIRYPAAILIRSGFALNGSWTPACSNRIKPPSAPCQTELLDSSGHFTYRAERREPRLIKALRKLRVDYAIRRSRILLGITRRLSSRPQPIHYPDRPKSEPYQGSGIFRTARAIA